MNKSFQLFPEVASTIAEQTDPFYFFMIAVSAVFSLAIAAVIILFAVKYKRRSEDEKPEPVHGSLVLEILWSVVPLGLALMMFGWGAKIFFMISRPPDDAIQIYAVGKQWMWKMQHMEGPREINELHIPVGRAVKVTMTSEDVIHSFFVPAFRTKADAVPGKYTTTWFKPTKVGQYHLFCAEYCGTKHSGMIGSIFVMEPSQYQSWLSGGSDGSTLAEKGAKLFQELACTNCHHADGSGRGPSLNNVFGQPQKLANGETVIADVVYLRESILNPGAKVLQTYENIMPTFQGLVTEDQVLALIEYIKSLSQAKDKGGKGGVPTKKAPAAAPVKTAAVGGTVVAGRN